MIKNTVCYSYSLNNEDPMAHLRLIGPLRKSGIKIVNGIIDGHIIVNRVAETDMVIVQREISNDFHDYMKIIESAHKAGKPVVFDLDDLLFCLPENHPDRQSTVYGASLLPMFQAILEADLVTVSTRKLRDFVLKFNKNVAVLPNYLNDDLWHLKPPVLRKSENKEIIIGYMGGNSHKPDLEFILPVLIDLLRRYSQKIRFQFWGTQPPGEIASLPQVYWSPVNTYNYKAFSAFFQTQTADIFIAPLDDSFFNRCKSPIKFFEYSALGVPGIFSCLEPYMDVITHGHEGLLASSLDDWTNCLIQLIEDKELRFNIAKNAQDTIRENWLLSQNGFRWGETFQNAFALTPVLKRKREKGLIGIVKSINFQLYETFNKRDVLIQNLTAEETKRVQTSQVLAVQIAEMKRSIQTLVTQITEKEQSVQALNAELVEKERSKEALAAKLSQKEQSEQVLLAQVLTQSMQVVTLSTQIVAFSKQVAEMEKAIQALQIRANDKEQEIRTLSSRIIEKEQTLLELSMKAALQEKTIKELSAQVTEKDQTLQLLSVQMADREIQTTLLQGKLQEITVSKAWHLALIMQRLRVSMLPHGSWRMRFVRKILPVLLFPFTIRRSYRVRRDLTLIRNSGLFDQDWYLRNNLDVRQANMDPLSHFLHYGWKEGRNPSQEFDTNYYLETNPDIKKAQINPLLHYIQFGNKEGRLCAHPSAISSKFKTSKNTFNPKVSIIVPNYNHASYLEERLSSIYSQTYKNFEVILLDDCSSDDSRRILEVYQKNYKEITCSFFNEVNSGSPFSQWEKGISYSNADLIWIAESDDFCDPDFLEKIIPFFFDETILLSYAHSIFVDENGNKHNFAFEHYLEEIDPHKWDSSYIETSHYEVCSSLGLKNSIPNVSSVVFRRPKENFLLFADSDWRRMEICGDWLFYLHLLRGGKIAFCRETHNYFRIHKESSSKRTHKEDVFYKEHEKVACAIASLYKVSDQIIYRNWQIWKDFYSNNVKGGDISQFSKLFNINKVKRFKKYRGPNILMVIHGFSIGGGEIFPIRLANAMKDYGASVTMFNGGYEPDIKVRGMLYPEIPVINYSPTMDINSLIQDYGIDIIHTHHASMENLFALKREKRASGPKHVATMHGMYEMMDNFSSEIKEIIKSVDHWFYLSEKNIVPFKENGLYHPEKFSRIGNGMKIPHAVNKVDLTSLNINLDSFTFCVASRALPEKGWIETVEATIRIRKTSNKDIHLILLGEGPVYDCLIKQNLPAFIHLLGVKDNVLGYLASSQLGILPTYFKGESCPLMVIECIMAEKPIIASNIGEITKMITTDNNLSAGTVITLHNGKIDSIDLAEAMVKFVLDKDHYNNCVAAAKLLKDRYDIDKIAQQYLKGYEQIINDQSISLGVT